MFVKQRLLLLLMVIASIFSFGSQGFVYLLPMIADQILHVSSIGLGWLWSSLSIGVLLATVWLFAIKEDEICRRMLLMAAASAAGGAGALVLLFPWPFFVAVLLIAGIPFLHLEQGELDFPVEVGLQPAGDPFHLRIQGVGEIAVVGEIGQAYACDSTADHERGAKGQDTSNV